MAPTKGVPPQVSDMVHYFGLDGIHYPAVVITVYDSGFRQHLDGKPRDAPPQALRVMVIGIQTEPTQLLFTDCEEDPTVTTLQTWHWSEPEGQKLPVPVVPSPVNGKAP